MDQDGEGRHVPKAASFFDREYSLDPTVSLVALSAKAALSPQDAEPQGSLGPIICGFNPNVIEEDPQ